MFGSKEFCNKGENMTKLIQKAEESQDYRSYTMI